MRIVKRPPQAVVKIADDALRKNNDQENAQEDVKKDVKKNAQRDLQANRETTSDSIDGSDGVSE